MAMSLSRLSSSVRSAILARSAGTMATHLGCRRKGMEIKVSEDPHTDLLLSRYGKPGSQKYELMKRLLKQLYKIWTTEELPMVYRGDNKEAFKRMLTCEKALKLLVERNPELHYSSIAMRSKSPAEEEPPWGFPPSVMRCYARLDFDEDGNVICDEEGYPVMVKVMDGTILSRTTYPLPCARVVEVGAATASISN